jgi:hypothetical protein
MRVLKLSNYYLHLDSIAYVEVYSDAIMVYFIGGGNKQFLDKDVKTIINYYEKYLKEKIA